MKRLLEKDNQFEESGLAEGILFIDEINCVSETLAPAMLQFLQYKTFGNHAIPEGWVIVAAGNPPEYNKSVREFDVVTMDRVKKIEVEPDFSVWKEYAYLQEIHPAVISYLTTRVGYFYQMETTVDGMLFATPRGWEDLSRIIQVYEKIGLTVDWEVVIQYIQYPKIAKDFANYLELYYKYQADYQIDQVIQGNIDPILVKKIGHASFDEKLSVVSLVLAKAVEAFRQTYREEAYMTVLLKKLKAYKSGTLSLEEIRCETERTLQAKKKAKILNKEESYALKRVMERLEEYEKLLREAGNPEREKAFEFVKEAFAKENAAYQNKVEHAGQILEYAFDFMEIAFGNSQEMTVFVTELNSNFFSVQFLQSYECERYYQYNKNLLFDEKRRNILNRIDSLVTVHTSVNSK